MLLCIYAKNCVEWFLCMLACVRHSIIIVPLYDTLGPDAAAYIVDQTQTK